ncbi:MAG: replication-associated recombination protein A, partial [Candidatus Puniceispirillaceae bacterium]
ALEAILTRVEAHIGHGLPMDAAARADLCAMADGDGRYLLNMAALLVDRPATSLLDTAALAQIVAARAPAFDKTGDQHYNLMSA